MTRAFLAPLLLFVSFAAAQAQPRVDLAEPGQVSLDVEIIAQGLERPWGLAFLPDGSQLVTERPGRLRHIDGDQISTPIAGLPSDIHAEQQGGLLDILVHPNFADNRLIFFTYSQHVNGLSGTTVARAELDVEALRLENLTLIYEMQPRTRSRKHYGSRLAFASDHTLFVTLGDRNDPARAQDPFDPAGKVLRLHLDGSIPADNPFSRGQNGLPEIWSLGHRNPQGAAIHPRTGALWTLSHGPAGGDELNLTRAGQNYGWPRISYGTHYNGTGFANGSAAPGLEQPQYYWDPSIAPSGLTYYDPPNPQIPAWSGSFLVGALKFQHLSQLRLSSNQVTDEHIYLQSELGRIRDVRTGPDGAVWLLTDSPQGQLVRLTQAL